MGGEGRGGKGSVGVCMREKEGARTGREGRESREEGGWGGEA